MDLTRRILGELLDRYERSAHYRRVESKRTVFIKPEPGLFPSCWDDTNSGYRPAFHSTALDLEKSGVIQLRWKRHALGVELERMTLCLNHLEDAYRIAGRRPKAEQVETLQCTALAWRERVPEWGRDFIDSLVDAISQGRGLPCGFQPQDNELLSSVLEAVAALDPEKPLPRRVFSIRVFGTSKKFEAVVERTLLSVLRRFHPAGMYAETDQELLSEVGLTANPDFIFVAGPLALDSGDRSVAIGDFWPSVGISAQMVEHATVASLEATRILTVENLTTFSMLATERGASTLLIYLGGYHNSVRRQFLQRLWKARPDARFEHWGDIDLGGFQVFHLLREGSGVPLVPYLMDLDTYRKYAHTGTDFDERYRRKLQVLLGLDGYECFGPVIAEMLKVNKRIEQEAIEL